MLKNILIHNVKVFDAATKSFSEKCDILVTDGIVAQIAPSIPCQAGYEVVEAENLCASTGWTDCHTHIGGFDPIATYPALGVTRIHDAGSYGAFTFKTFHDANAKIPFPLTTYLYVGVYGVGNGELTTLDNLQEAPFLEVAKQYPDEILGAKIRIDPRVNCDTKKSLRMAKELAVKAGLPLIVHPSRCTDTIEDIVDVLDKDDVYAHTYSPVCPGIFEENGDLKPAMWKAMERGVRFDLSHGSNNLSYDIARKCIQQGFIVETISTDLHGANYNRPGIDLAGVMTKAIHCGISLEDALVKVIINPSLLLHVAEKPATIEVGQTADITLFTVSDEGIEMPDVTKVVETCETVVEDYATIIGATLTRSKEMAVVSDTFWA